MTDPRLLNAILRRSLSAFTEKVFATVSPADVFRPNWHIDSIVHHLERVHAGDFRRLMILQPPRSLKSICTSVSFVAWALGHNPSLRFICVSYAQELAEALARQFRVVVESDWYREVFPAVKLDKRTAAEVTTSLGGGRFATSVGGTLTGRGADIIVIDDPMKAAEATAPSPGKKKNRKASQKTETVAADTEAAPTLRPGSKLEAVVNLMRRPEGATIDDIMAATNWQAHSVRGAISGSLKRKLGLEISSKAEDGRGRVYRIVAPSSDARS